MQFVRNSLFRRSTTMFGVCEALGQDFKVNPNWFRVALAVVVIYNIEAAVIAYAGAGVLVLISRMLYPDRFVAVDEASAIVEAPVAPEAPTERALAQAA